MLKMKERKTAVIPEQPGVQILQKEKAVERKVNVQPLQTVSGYVASLQDEIGNRAVGKLQNTGKLEQIIQGKFNVSKPSDPCEQEADQIAESAGHSPGHNSIPSLTQNPSIQTKSQQANPLPQEAGNQISMGIRENGHAIPLQTKDFFEKRFGQNFSNVRIHTGEKASRSAETIKAKAYTLGNDIVFAKGEYKPDNGEGRKLLAHELTHVVQQSKGGKNSLVMKSDSNSDKYTPKEKEQMKTGNIKATEEDINLAKANQFEAGDIVFRLGNKTLAKITNNPVTHGGIYLGNGIVHDMVGFGNRYVRASQFYQEANDPSMVKVMRFTGPYKELIIARLLSNIQKKRFNLPADKKPWNLFSSAMDYQTANCLEFVHAQFLFAIKDLSEDKSLSPEIRANIIKTYFTSNRQNSLIKPQSIKLEGQMGVPINEMRALLIGANMAATDIDSNIFENRFEGTEKLETIGPSFNPTIWQTIELKTFTYQSFVESSKFFKEVK